MASGSFDLSSSNQYVHLWCEWSSSANVSSNSSSVVVKLYGRRTNSGYTTYGSGSASVKVGNSSLSESNFSYSFTNGSSFLFFNRSFVVNHDADGRKTVVISCSFSGNSPISGSGSKSVSLDTIPRYASVSHSLSGVGLDSFKISWSSDSSCDLVQYSLNGGSWKSVSGNPYSVSGLSPNTSYKVKTRVRRKDSQLYSETGELTVTTKDLGRILSVSDFDHGGNASVRVSNPSRCFFEFGNEGRRLSGAFEVCVGWDGFNWFYGFSIGYDL